MNQIDRFREIVTSYRKHGWELRRVLVCEQTRLAFAVSGEVELTGIEPEASAIDGIWFARPSHAGREAWELRLVGDMPYALFEAFEAGLDNDLREEKLREIEARMIEYAARA